VSVLSAAEHQYWSLMIEIYTGQEIYFKKYIFNKYKNAENKGISTTRVRILYIEEIKQSPAKSRVCGTQFSTEIHMCTQRRTFVLKSQ
jgi:tyrosine-protein phosphatase YwqE